MQRGLQDHGKEGEVFGTPLGVAGGAPGQLRGAAALLPEQVGTGQGRARRRCHLEMPPGFACSHPSQQGHTGMEGAGINWS